MMMMTMMMMLINNDDFLTICKVKKKFGEDSKPP